MDAMLLVPGSNYGEVRVTAEAVETDAPLTYIEKEDKPKGDAAAPEASASEEEDEEDDEPVARSA